jgi:high-affinity nickel-transport protein
MTAWRSVAPGEALAPLGARIHPCAFDRSDWLRLAALYGAVAVLHVAGWGAYLYHAPGHPALVGLGFVAYLLGLRHAFDADHIAAVDDTVRYLHQRGRRPLGVGFFFSLGHASVVCVLALVLLFAAAALKDALPTLQHVGSIVGPAVSGAFLWFIGFLNLLVLRDLVVVSRKARSGAHGHAHVDELLGQRGLMQRLLGGRLQRVIRHSWQMYPLGLLFGLGFDTATEVGMLAMTAGASAADMPVLAVMSLPLLFAAGMTLLDTTDGVLMTRAYDWAFVNPLRRISYNVGITTLSVVVALGIGTVQWLQVIVGVLGLSGPFAGGLAALDLGVLGALVVGLFAVAWVGSVVIWKLARLEERYGPAPAPHSHVHEHEHGGGVTHAHRHFH